MSSAANPSPRTTPTAGRDDPRVARLADFFEQLGPLGLSRLGEVYARDARFKDPYNEVQGIASIEAIFVHMYETLREPRFVVHDTVTQGDQAFLTWDFQFTAGPHSRRAVAMSIKGASHVRFNQAGLVCEHRDYWDVAEELYEKLPVIGPLMRLLKRRLAAPKVPGGSPTMPKNPA